MKYKKSNVYIIYRMSVRLDSYSPSPNGRINISSVLSIENVGKSAYKCQYKNHHIEYSELKLNETRAHSIYENFNEIRYELFKYWFYNHKSYRPSTTTEQYKLEMTLDLINYLKDKDFFEMSDIDKILLTILYHEMMRFKKD